MQPVACVDARLAGRRNAHDPQEQSPQLEGGSIAAIACVSFGVAAMGLCVSLHRALARSLRPLQAGVRAIMYVFAWDRSLVCHAFAGKPHNLRKTAAQILGTDVSQLAHDVWAAAAQRGGWVDYDFLNPSTGQVAPKTSFVVPVGADLVLGCGIYKTVQRH